MTARWAASRLAACAAVWMLAPTASAQVADRLADLRLATAVRLALVDDVRTRALDVSVAARDGGVEVSGRLDPRNQRMVAEIARAVPGVRVLGGEAAATDGPAGRVQIEPRRDERPPRPAERLAGRSASGALYHTVERGDTLFGLARRYDTSVEAILALNDRQSTGIQVGRRLRVR